MYGSGELVYNPLTDVYLGGGMRNLISMVCVMVTADIWVYRVYRCLFH